MKMMDLKQIQYEEKEMLRKFIGFLNEKNLKYYIWGGTFLGAVRHNGFIPWDDDIDVAMTRPEYDKLINYIKQNGKKIDDNLEFIGFELGSSYYPFLKVINKKIKISEKLNTVQNLWIDIFPLDCVGKNTDRFFKKHKSVRRIYMLIRAAHYYDLPDKDSFKHTILHYIYKTLKKLNLQHVTKKYEKHCQKYDYDDSEKISNVIWGFNRNIAYLSKDMLVSQDYEFEDLKVNGMKDYDTILRRLYGNYMKIPLEGQRETHNFKAWRIDNEN